MGDLAELRRQPFVQAFAPLVQPYQRTPRRGCYNPLLHRIIYLGRTSVLEE
jgi:hypothetical protein